MEDIMTIGGFFASLPKWNVEEETGYKPVTTFWQDFSVADAFGGKAVRDTYNRAFNSWRSDHIYLTELVMVLNHKIWQHYDEGNLALSRLYNKLWEEADEWALANLFGDKLDYFIRTLD